MVSVVYEAPETVQDAVTLLVNADVTATVMAGGTDLIIQMRDLVNESRLVVDLKKIPGMMQATITDKGLELGPSMSCAEFTRRDDIKALYPGLVESAYLIGSTQVQGRASVGGNLCNSSPAADTIPALFAIGAKCLIVGPDGERTVPVEDFVTGVGQNCLGKGELLRLITIAKPAANTSDAYLRFIPRSEMDIAVAGAGVSVTLNDEGVCTAARVAIGAVATTAILVPEAAEALIGSKLDETALQAASEASSAASRPITDRRGTVEYRRHVVGVLTKRAAAIAAQRARGNKA
jgi:CO/xanthine dehydrogenase FAD-binding subunit